MAYRVGTSHLSVAVWVTNGIIPHHLVSPHPGGRLQRGGGDGIPDRASRRKAVRRDFPRGTALGVAGRNLHPGAKTRLYKLENLARRRTFPLFPPPPPSVADRQNASALPHEEHHDDVRQGRLNTGVDAVGEPCDPDRHDENEQDAEDSGRRLEARRHGQAL
jgi:hypothetical protein